MATTVTVRLKKLLQNRQELGLDNEYMISTVYFDLKIGDRVWPNQEVNIKQAAGGSRGNPRDAWAGAGQVASRPAIFDANLTSSECMATCRRRSRLA